MYYTPVGGDIMFALAAHHARLDEHDVAADRRVIHPRGDAHLVLSSHPLGMHLRPPDEIGDLLRPHDDALSHAVGDLACDLAAELADLALELAHSRLAGVARDDLDQRGIRERELMADQAVLAQLPGHEIAL